MRRVVVTFDVQGSSKEELEKRAVEVYRSYVGDPNAELPASAAMEVRSLVITSGGTIDVWEGIVTVAVTSS